MFREKILNYSNGICMNIPFFFPSPKGSPPPQATQKSFCESRWTDRRKGGGGRGGGWGEGEKGDQEGEGREGFFWPGRRATRKLARLPRMEKDRKIQGFTKVHKKCCKFCRNRITDKMSILTIERIAAGNRQILPRLAPKMSCSPVIWDPNVRNPCFPCM